MSELGLPILPFDMLREFIIWYKKNRQARSIRKTILKFRESRYATVLTPQIYHFTIVPTICR